MSHKALTTNLPKTRTETEKRNWVFTFCQNSPNKNNYIVINGTFKEARDKMFKRFGSNWAFQYDSKAMAGVYNFNLKELK